MAKIRRVWGPSKRADTKHKVVWTYSAEHESGRTAMYRLTFFLDSRRFKTTHLGEDKQAAAYAATMLTALEPLAEPFEGRVTDLLKSRIPRAQLAEITAMAILYGRK